MKSLTLLPIPVLVTGALATRLSFSGGSHQGGIQAQANQQSTAVPTLDIVHARITSNNTIATFHVALSGEAGISKPKAIGRWWVLTQTQAYWGSL